MPTSMILVIPPAFHGILTEVCCSRAEVGGSLSHSASRVFHGEIYPAY